MQAHDTVSPGRQLNAHPTRTTGSLATAICMAGSRRHCARFPLAGGGGRRLVCRMAWWPVGFVLFAAAMLPVQAACNAALNRALAHPFLTILISMAGSIVSVSVVGLLTGRLANLPVGRFGYVPWWAWAAGLGGAFYVSSQPFAIPKLGAALFTSLAVTGQVAAAMLIDHFGALQIPQHPASPMRILGAALIVVGMALVARF